MKFRIGEFALVKELSEYNFNKMAVSWDVNKMAVSWCVNKMAVSWDVTPCILVVIARRFRGTYCFLCPIVSKEHTASAFISPGDGNSKNV
jgi:hypothetical protein